MVSTEATASARSQAVDRSALGPESRAAALAEMASTRFDVVVVGGGVVGAGAALDAAARGLSVALLEQRDYASGTSSRSSKLIHGGLRYLESFDFALVLEALKERGRLLGTLCPHLVKPVSFLIPLKHRVWERAYMGAGVALYDVLASRGENPLPRHKHLSRRKALELVPGLADDALIGAILYWDAQVDDARHTMTLARTAARYGAVMATSTQVVGFDKTGERVTGVVAKDLETGNEITIKARQVINATGTWTDQVQDLAGRGTIHVRASKGIHLVVPRDRIHGDSGIVIKTSTSVLFIIPWDRHWLIGTTDTEWALDLAYPAASRADIDYLLEKTNEVLRSKLTHDDIEGVYAGLRPLLHGETDDTSELSREHAVSQPVPGLVTIAGGKYTTYRVMAADAVNAAARNLPGPVPASCTEDLLLVGADGYEAMWNRRSRLAAESGLTTRTIEHLLGRYGSLATEVLALIADRPDLGELLHPDEDYLRAEVIYSTSHEGALHLDDVLTRRTRLSIEVWDRATDVVDDTAGLMGEILGWDDADREREIAHYCARVAAERESQTMQDDATADAARLGAVDVRRGEREGA